MSPFAHAWVHANLSYQEIQDTWNAINNRINNDRKHLKTEWSAKGTLKSKYGCAPKFLYDATYDMLAQNPYNIIAMT